MSKLTHILFQVLGMAVQVGNLASGLVPLPYQPFVAALTAAAQAGLALYNHKS